MTALHPYLHAVMVDNFPKKSATVTIPAQEWPLEPGLRSIAVHIVFPGEDPSIREINPETGLMLSLHNWGGTGFQGTAEPKFLAERYNVVVIGVDYLQSGPWPEQPFHPYDFGWLQAFDALRALFFVYDELTKKGLPFAKDRLFITGGSGGGNIALMANKLAPATFGVVVDLCGMKKLNDEIAFNLSGSSNLKASYSQDPANPSYLTPDAQEIRFLGHPAHLAYMKALGCAAKIITVHGSTDDVCPYADALEFAENMEHSGLDFTFVPVTTKLIDPHVYQSTGHALGDRTMIVDRVAGEYLDPKNSKAVRAQGRNNFEMGNEVRYRTSEGTWIIDYARGVPEGRFEAGSRKTGERTNRKESPPPRNVSHH